MPFLITPKVFKQQTKILVNHWPFSGFKTAYARKVLSQLYGYKDDHQYLKFIKERPELLTPLSKKECTDHYFEWVKALAQFGSMNHIQAKTLLHKLWPMYLEEYQQQGEPLYRASIRFFGDSIDFLTAYKEGESIEYTFNDPPSIKDAIEAIGVPHPEVGAIKKNGVWAGFNEKLTNNDTVEVYSNPYPKQQMLPYKPDGKIEFLLDVHLSGLARYLRMAGFSCLHEKKDVGDALLAEFSSKEDVILLTRDVGLLKRSKVKYAHWVRNVLPEEQFKEVVDHYSLHSDFLGMTRCVKCNGDIEKVDKSLVKEQVPEGVYAWQNEFQRCASCEQVYWKGTHYEKIQKILDNAKVSDVLD